MEDVDAADKRIFHGMRGKPAAAVEGEVSAGSLDHLGSEWKLVLNRRVNSMCCKESCRVELQEVDGRSLTSKNYSAAEVVDPSHG